MYCGCNKTALASQRQIAAAMLELLREKPFDQISVCEISKASGISRQTFYTLFSSREEVISFILREKYECPNCLDSPDENQPCSEDKETPVCFVKENSVCSDKERFAPDEPGNPEGPDQGVKAESKTESGSNTDNPQVRILCRNYSVYIHSNREFIQTLVDHHLDHLLYDSVYDSLNSCFSFITKADSCARRYAAAFYAGGISSMARCYALEGCTCSEKDLEDKLYTLFLGKLF